jgi:dTDP-4-amino-4,6-dideoxygalactose transaminase
MIVPITRPDVGAAEIAAAERVLRSGWIMMGPEVAAFEAELAAFVGAPHVVAVANGTVALELALRAQGVGPGDEVVTVSHSFIATANAVVAVGARPVLVDVEEDTLGMDPRAVGAALGPRTRAVLAVHQVGIPCDIEGILAAAGAVPVLEDAACAIGSAIAPVPRGVAACFSFHPRKVLTTGEGGAIATADAALAARLRRLRAHGLEGGRYLEPATNARMTDIQAAIGRAQLARIDAILAERRRIAARYQGALERSAALAPPRVHGTNWQSYPARARRGDGAALVAALAARGISARGGIGNAHEEPAYAGGRARIAGSLAVSERLRRETVLLPLFHGMTMEEEAAVLAAIAAL